WVRCDSKGASASASDGWVWNLLSASSCVCPAAICFSAACFAILCCQVRFVGSALGATGEGVALGVFRTPLIPAGFCGAFTTGGRFTDSGETEIGGGLGANIRLSVILCIVG